ncbi:MAG: S9 family peptidase [Polyangiaceae bacterium]|nr:S9 family peptidase [Polyangiaceae bacterium]
MIGARTACVLLALGLFACGGARTNGDGTGDLGNGGARPTASASAPKKPYPATAVQKVDDTYHGVVVSDSYRWLEDGKDAKVRAWSDAQNVYARSVLEKLPQVPAVKARLTTLLGDQSPRYFSMVQRGGSFFLIKDQPPKQQPFLIVQKSLDDVTGARVLVDPNVLDAKGTTAIDWFFPSWDGKLVAVSLSMGGTESGDLHVIDVATGKEVFEVIPRVNGGTAGGSLTWDKDNKGFSYTRYPRAGERAEADMDFYVQVFHHKLGTTPDKDTYELGKDFPRIAEIELKTQPKTGHLLVTVQKGDGGEFALYLRKPGGTFEQLARFEDQILQGDMGDDGSLYVLSRKGAPRGKILRTKLDKPDLEKAAIVVPEGPDTIVPSFWDAPSIIPTKDRLFVLYQTGGPSEIRAFELAGKPVDKPKQLAVAAAGDMTRVGDRDLVFANWSFVEPPAYYRYDAAKNTTTKTPLASTSPADMSGYRVVREMAKSKDGTEVPVNILLPKGYADGTPIPCIVNGYGGYGVSLAPRFRAYFNLLLENGVCYAVANLRGGGEYGEAWHRDGNLTKKQNVFDDFHAVLEHLKKRGYTTRDKLGIIGGSNGGLLMGASFTQHPDDAKAVVSLVGIYDMLRVELSPNGAFNVTEFGTVKDEAQFKALFAYSPYHNVKDGTSYPPVLMLTGANDPRVDPMQSRKMIARLQAATSNDSPILLRTSQDSGHGGDTSLEQEIAELTDIYSFLFSQLGVTAKTK